jgi:hypothetical protein
MRELIVTMAGPYTCRDNGTDQRQEEILHVVLGGCPVSVWENIDSFPTSRETFCNVYGPQCCGWRRRPPVLEGSCEYIE